MHEVMVVNFVAFSRIVCIALLIAARTRPESDRPGMMCHDADVIVLGAGISGVSAALALHRNGVERVMILEGRNVTGGRFKNTRLGKANIELGPNWVHGTANNPIFDLVKRYNINGQFEKTDSVVCRDENGSDITSQFTRVRKTLKGTLDKIGLKNWKVSLREALSLSGWLNASSLENIAEISLIDFMEAVPPELISASLEIPGNIRSELGKQFFVTDDNGFAKIIKEMLREFLERKPDRIRLDNVVSKIYWNKNGVRVSTIGGDFYTAKVVIITFSIGVLQKLQSLFSPDLPSWKLHALKKVKMATYTKIFLLFPYRFWDNVEYIFFSSQRRGYFPVWQSLDASGRFIFDTNILIMTVTDQESFRIESMTEETVVKEIMQVLYKVYGYHIPKPTSVVIPKWTKDEFFYGSYSYLPVNVSHEDFVALRGNVGPLLFAGETLHEMYQGYLHGAYFEGINRAFDALQLLNGYRNLSNFDLDYDYYDECFRDVCECCSKLPDE